MSVNCWTLHSSLKRPLERDTERMDTTEGTLESMSSSKQLLMTVIGMQEGLEKSMKMFYADAVQKEKEATDDFEACKKRLDDAKINRDRIEKEYTRVRSQVVLSLAYSEFHKSMQRFAELIASSPPNNFVGPPVDLECSRFYYYENQQGGSERRDIQRYVIQAKGNTFGLVSDQRRGLRFLPEGISTSRIVVTFVVLQVPLNIRPELMHLTLNAGDEISLVTEIGDRSSYFGGQMISENILDVAENSVIVFVPVDDTIVRGTGVDSIFAQIPL